MHKFTTNVYFFPRSRIISSFVRDASKLSLKFVSKIRFSQRKLAPPSIYGRCILGDRYVENYHIYYTVEAVFLNINYIFLKKMSFKKNQIK